jgi:cardiolipin synthase
MMLWENETFAYSGGEYFALLMDRVRRAKFSIRIESYIFELGAEERTLLEELKRAAARGVKVRILIDAIGSPQWRWENLDELARMGVRVRVFGRPRELFKKAMGWATRGQFMRALRTLRKLQLRDHRKLAIFDSEEAFVGSSNIGSTFHSWRETTALLKGPGVAALKRSFVRSWRLAARERIPEDMRVTVVGIRSNFTRYEREIVNRRFVERVRAVENRLWMTTAYFHPRPKLLLALFHILKRRADLRILVPRHSDISWFPWLSRTAYAGLIANGAKVYEYNGPMLHAKTTLFDDELLVGSTNMNHRSFMHDLELDVVIESPAAVAMLEDRFKRDCQESILLTQKTIRQYGLIAFLVSLFLTPFKRWL